MRVPKGHCFFKKLNKLNTTLSPILHYYSVRRRILLDPFRSLLRAAADITRNVMYFCIEFARGARYLLHFKWEGGALIFMSA